MSLVFRRKNTPVPMPDSDRCLIKIQCGSCRYINGPYAQGLQEKHEQGVTELGQELDMKGIRVLPPVPSPKPTAYRSYLKLAVRPTRHGVGIGLFERGSHALVDITSCPLHFPGGNALLQDLKRLIPAHGLTPYDEKSHTGDIRYLTMRVNRSTGAMSLVIIATSEIKARLRDFVKALKTAHKLTGIHLNINPDVTNRIFGDTTMLLWGHDFAERFADLDFEFGPTSFSQVNFYQAENIYRRLESIVGPVKAGGAVAWDLYCGVGQISCVLARLGHHVVGIEENPDAIARAEQNFHRNNLNTKSAFLAGRVGDQLDLVPAFAARPDLIIANPSRKGLESEVRLRLGGLLAEGAPTLIYVSCDLSTFKRDLVDLGRYGYKLRQLESFDMFAQTDKLEWLGILTK